MKRVIMFSATLLAAFTLGVAPVLGGQSQPWRIGVGGAWQTGYMGVLTRYGFPREQLSDQQLADPAYLRKFQILLVGDQVESPSAVVSALGEFVRQGGIAFQECSLLPPAGLVPGRRIGPAAGPNIRFLSGSHPLLQGLPSARILPTSRRRAAALIPDSKDAIVIARFTDEGAHAKVRGRFVYGGRGAPAIVYVPVGKGHLIYCGMNLARMLTLSREGYEGCDALLLNVLQYFSHGDLQPRLRHVAVSSIQEDRRLPTCPAIKSLAGTKSDPPPNFEVIEDSTAELQEFNLTAQSSGDPASQILFDYFGPRFFRSVRLGPETVSIEKTEDGKHEVLASVKLRSSTESSQVMLRRRWGYLAVFVDGVPVIGVADGEPWDGSVAVRGLSEASCQSCGYPEFTDNFMRKEGELGQWDRTGGSWELISSEGEPETAANPFALGVTSSEPVFGSTGFWFWEDYEAQAAVRFNGPGAGLAAHYQDPQNCVLLVLRKSPDAEPNTATLALIRRLKGEEKTLSEKTVRCDPTHWFQLRLQASSGLVRGWLDGQPVLETWDGTRGCGKVALYSAGGSAVFDDVYVRPWRAFVPYWARPVLRHWDVASGSWKSVSGNPGALETAGSGELLSPWRGWRDLKCTARVQRSRSKRVGLYLRYQDPRNHYLLSVVPGTKGQSALFLGRVLDGKKEVLAHTVLPGGTDSWTTLTALVQRQRLRILADGKPVLDYSDIGPDSGGVGFFASGKGKGAVSDLTVFPLRAIERPADPPVAPYAGAIDLHTWARPEGSWCPEPAHLGRFWHRGDFPGDLSLRYVLHRDGSAQTVARLFLAADVGQAEQGYELRGTADFDAGKMKVQAFRGGQEVAAAQQPLAAGSRTAQLALERVGSALVGHVAGQPVLVYRDPQPLSGLRRVAVEVPDGRLVSEDLQVVSPMVHSYDFARAPTDWSVDGGTWTVSSRWTCTEKWAWFSGEAEGGLATIQTKSRWSGNLRVDLYVGAKMMRKTGSRRRREELRDIRFGICGDGEHLNAGYSFVIGAENNTWTYLQRDGRIVAETRSFRMPDASIHNDWLHFTIIKRGGDVRLLCRGWEVLSYRDEQPLDGGTVVLGTYDNGIMVPRITIFGREEI